MGLRTQMVGVTTLALFGFVVGVQQWAEQPLKQMQALRTSRHARYAPPPARPLVPLARPPAAPAAPADTEEAAAAQPQRSTEADPREVALEAEADAEDARALAEDEEAAPPVRSSGELQRVAVEAGIPRADRVDPRTGEGLEVPSPVHDARVAQDEGEPVEALPAGELVPAEPPQSAPVPEGAGPPEERDEDR